MIPEGFQTAINLFTDLKFKDLRLVGGIDLSFHPTDEQLAIAVLTICSFPELQVGYSSQGWRPTLIAQYAQLRRSIIKKVVLTEPYIPNYLSFRESGHAIALLEECQKDFPEDLPQVILVDGNGRWHLFEVGLAVSIGVKFNIPTIGVAKEFLPIVRKDDAAINKDTEWLQTQKSMKEFTRKHITQKGRVGRLTSRRRS